MRSPALTICLEDPRQGVHERKHRETALLQGHVDGLPAKVRLTPALDNAARTSSASSPSLASMARCMTRAKASRRASRLAAKHPDDPANLEQGLVDVGRMLAAELHDFDRIPDDVVLADGLEPERLDAQRSPPDFRVPEEEARGERFAADLCPSGRIDEEGEHVLLSAVQSRSSVEALLRGLESVGRLQHDVQQFGIMQPRIAGPVDGAGVVTGR